MEREAEREGRAGARMVETMIRLKPVRERMEVTDHFRVRGQSLGLRGSFGWLKEMRIGSGGLDGSCKASGWTNFSALLSSVIVWVLMLFCAPPDRLEDDELYHGPLSRRIY